MCGIAGAVFVEASEQARQGTAVVGAMVRALGHRGPDGHGVLSCRPAAGAASGVVLGHTRLAILDLSERGAQPMTLESAPMSITYNGEIFNFAAVRRDLEALGRRFRSQSDSEVILQGYDEWGPAVVDRLRGMFAFAIWDGRRGELLLARDRLGIKPLYVYEDKDCLLFASEVRALLATGLVPRRLDRAALDDYLTYQTVASPRTLVDRVRMVLPGHTVRVANGRQVERPYWDLLDNASSEAASAGRAEARVRVRQLLEESAALHLVSDVPVGIFLSGGIDSTALVGLTRATGATPRTFSVILPGTAHDEAAFARVAAARFESLHTEIVLGARELTDAMPGALAHVDHPSGDGINTFVVSRAVRAAGIKVALSGLGGDEIFGGYPSFSRLRRLAPFARAWQRSPRRVRAAAAAAVRAWGGQSIASGKAAALLEGDGTLAQTFPVMRQLFTDAERRALLDVEGAPAPPDRPDPYTALLAAAAARHPEAGFMSMVSFGEVRTYMHDVLLRDTDQMSMAHGLEARVPLLDQRLVEYVMGLPDDVKAPAGTPKRLLVESLDGLLPAECVERPKQGFVLPFDGWMKGELRPFCEHHLGPDGLGGRGLVSRGAIASLWQAYLAGDRRTTWSRPWTLVALNAWLEQNGITA